MAVLYRKYRPKSFSEILGQKHIVQTLTNQVKNATVAHAYLFTGSRGVGKTSVARILAKAVNCTSKGSKVGDACGECGVCQSVSQGNFIDLVEIDAASNTGVDHVRDLIEHVRFAPSVGKFKVFIIDEVHMLSKGAFNALLKTLEEPPAHAIFILATTEIHKVPETIVSRTQRFDFKRLGLLDLKKQILQVLESEKIKLETQVVDLVASNAEGSARDVLTLLEKVLTLGQKVTLEESRQLLGVTDLSVCENLLSLIVEKKAQEIPNFFSKLLDSGLDFTILNKDFLEYLRKVLIVKVSGDKSAVLLEDEQLQRIEKFSNSLDLPELVYIIRLFLKSLKDLSFAPNAEVPLLLASLEAIYRNQTPKTNSTETKADKAQNHQVKEFAPPKVLTEENKGQTARPVQNVNITLTEIKKKWPEVVKKAKQHNGPLAHLIKNTNILRIEGDIVSLEVKFLFDKQSLQTQKHQEILQRILREVYSTNLNVQGEITKASGSKVKSPLNSTESLAEAIKVFGGELVD